jgi:MFS transporter, DHA2 family, multidrug resistance protein
MSEQAAAPTSRLKDWLGYLAMCLGMFMAILDIQIVASSLPDIQAGLDIPLDSLSWIQTAYLIAEIIAIPLTGWLTCLLSLRGLFLVSVIAFTLASLGCAASGSLALLLLFRTIQGFCGGAMIPATFTAVFTLFPERLHVRATAIGGLLAMLAPMLGPTLGGYITATFSWPWLFLINVGPGIVAAVVAAALLRTAKADRAALARFDAFGLVSFAVALAALELALKEGPKRGWSDALPLALLVVSLSGGLAGIRRCLSRPRPLVDLRPFAQPEFAASAFYSFVLGASLYGSVYLLPLFLGYVREHSALEIGNTMIVAGAAQFCAMPMVVLAMKRIGPLPLVAAGFVLLAAGLVTNGFATYRTDFAELFWPQVLRGAGVVLCLLPTTALALEGRNGEDLANASSLYNLLRNLGGAVWIALVDTVLQVRGPVHAAELARRLQAGDREAARFVGLPLERFQGHPLPPVSHAAQEAIRPLVERAAAVASFNEAWIALGLFTGLSLLALPLLRRG